MPTDTPTLEEMRAELAALPKRQQAAIAGGYGPEALALKHRAEDLAILIQVGQVGALNQQIYGMETQMAQIRAERVTLRTDADTRFAQAERDLARLQTEQEAAAAARQVAARDARAAASHGQDIETRLQEARARRDALLQGSPG